MSTDKTQELDVGESEARQHQRIDDPEDLSQNTRIQEILSRRHETLEARDRLKELVDLGEVSNEQALLNYRSRLESLVLELWNVFTSLESDDGEEYLKKREIATFKVPPPESLIEKVKELPPGASYPDTKTYKIKGLRWFLDQPSYITAEFELKSMSPPKTLRDTNEYILQWEELDSGLEAALEFIDVAGIDADVTEEEQQTKITRELLEEVEEWRQQHVDTEN